MKKIYAESGTAADRAKKKRVNQNLAKKRAAGERFRVGGGAGTRRNG